MKILYTVLFGLFFCNYTFGQVSEKIIALAQYKLTHQYDTLNRNHVNIEIFNLYLGKNSTHYKSYDKLVQDSIMMSEAKKYGSMAPPAGRRASNDEIFIYPKEQKLFENVSNLLGKYVVERSYPAINWKIFPEKKIIAGYQCQKANGNYHSRNYIVWFTNDLPFKAGPWKLTGLPGLIVKVEDSTNRIKFELISFKNSENNLNQTYWNKVTSVILWSDYVKIAKAIEEDPIGYMEKKFGGKLTVDSSKKPNHKNPMLPKKSINYPLEAIKYYTLK